METNNQNISTKTVRSGSVLHRIHVEGMDCRACEDLLVETLRRQPGIGAASADARTGTLTVLADRAIAGYEDIARVVVACGFVPEGVELAQPAVPAAPECPVPALAPVAESAPEAVATQALAPAIAAASEQPATREASFAVTGMTCASCVAVIEKTLAKREGILKVNVNLATEKMSVSYDPAVLDVDAIVDAVKKAGYGAIPLDTPAPAVQAPQASAKPAPSGGGTVTLGLIGMTCSSCAAVIEKTLNKVTGVSSASVNLAAETATVQFDPAVVGIDTLIQAVKGAGYDAVLRVETGTSADTKSEDAQAIAQAKHTKHQQFLFLLSLFLSLPAFLVSMVPPVMTVVPNAVATWLANNIGGAWDPMMVLKYLAFALTTPVQFYAGAQFYRGFWHALKRRTGNMDTLIAIGTSAAYFYSLAATFVPALHSEPVS